MSVTIYSTPTCPWCHKAKDFLKEHKVSYTDKDVSSDREAAKEMIEKSKQRGTPVLDINGKIIIGFNEPEIKKALGL